MAVAVLGIDLPQGGTVAMTRGRKEREERRRRMAELRKQGKTLQEIGDRFGVTRECVRQSLNPGSRKRAFRVRCRSCAAEVNPAGAVPRDDRAVLCTDCLAKRPDAGFGEHLHAYRLAAGMKVSALARAVGVSPSLISHYEHGRGSHPRWDLVVRLFKVLGVRPVGLLEPAALHLRAAAPTRRGRT